MRRSTLLAVLTLFVAGGGLGRADTPPAMAPGSTADGYPPTTHYETSCTNKCTVGREGNTVSHVVFLSSEGGKDATISTEQFDSGKSIHYFAANDGSVGDFVPEADTAWYAGDWTYNLTSIGIIVEGVISNPSSFGDLEYSRAAQLVAAISHRYQFPIDADHVLGRGSIPGTPYTGTGPDPSFDLVRLRALAQQYRDELDPPPPPPPTDTTTTTTTTPPPPPTLDTTPPALVVTTRRSQKLSGRIRVGVRCPAESCTLTGRAILKAGKRTYGMPGVRAVLAAGAARTVVFRLNARLRAAIKQHKAVATLTFVAVDGANNHTRVTRRLTLRR